MNARLKALFETLTTALILAAAIAVIYAQVEARWLAPRQAQQVQDIKDLNLRIESNKLRNVRGSSEVVLIEFTDYECPFCGRHAREVEPDLRDVVIDSRQLRHAIFNFPLEMHPRARPAAAAAECAGRQGRFWEMHDRLFAEDKKLSMDDFLNSGEDIGLDVNAFSRCLMSDAHLQITSDVAEARRLGVSATPTFFVGRIASDGSGVVLTKRIRGLLSAAELRNVIGSASSAEPPLNFLSWLRRSVS